MSGIIFNASKAKVIVDPETGEEILEEPKIQERSNDVEVKKNRFRFNDEKRKELEELYSTVVVRDFEDNYHKKITTVDQDVVDAYKTIGRMKSKYRNIEEYIVVMRKCVDFLKVIASKNTLIMKPEEFVSRALKRKIQIFGFNPPKYIGSDRKDINWNEVAKYVCDKSLDPNDLSMRSKEISYLEDDEFESDEARLKHYFSPEQIREIFGKKINHSVTMGYDEDLDNKGLGLVTAFSKKEIKRMNKDMPELNRIIKDYNKKMRAEDNLLQYAYEIESDAFDIIRKMDEKRGFFKKDKLPKFKGKLTSSKDIKRYLYELEKYREEHEYVNYRGNMMTLEEYNDAKTKDKLDEAGWNVRKLYRDKAEEKKQKEDEKMYRAKEKRLKKKLEKLDMKYKRETGQPLDEYYINKEKKKAKKKSKKKADRFADLASKEVSNGKHKSFSEYEEEMMNMTWSFGKE